MRGQITMAELLGDPQRTPEEKSLVENLRIEGRWNREQLMEALRYPYDMNLIVATLKKIHGIGGRSLQLGFAEYDASGLTIQIHPFKCRERGEWTEKKYTWKQVANELIKIYERGEL